MSIYSQNQCKVLTPELEGFYDGKCKNIHGHSYHLYVTVIGEPIEDINHPKNGMVLDFGDLKTESEIALFEHEININKEDIKFY